jgi:hypothetical protein
MTRTFRAAAIALSLFTAPALAMTRQTELQLRNAESALASGEREKADREAWFSAPVPAGDIELALRLHKQLEGLLNRASDAIQRCSAEDKPGAEVQAVYARWKTLRDAFVALTDNINAGNATAQSGKDKMRAFQQATQGEMKSVAKAFVPLLENANAVPSGYSSPPERLALARAQLEKLDALCKGEFAGLQDVPNLSFQLDTYPSAWCQVAAQREALTARVAMASVQQNLQMWVDQINEDAAGLERKEGFSGLMGVMYELVHETKPALARLSAQYQGQFKAAGAEMPADLLAPAQAAVDGWWKEARRLAPTWKYPTGLVADGAVEGRMKARVKKDMAGVTLLKSGLLYSEWKVYKNALGIPTDRVRTGVMLYKSPMYPAGLCAQREWTVKDTWVGGGKWSPVPDDLSLGSVRLQVCP